MFINGWTKEKVLEQIKKKNIGIVAVNEDGTCFYRQKINGGTNCCLVGAFIPDELYYEGMEKSNSTSIIKEYNLEEHMPMKISNMAILQDWHDYKLKTEMNDTGKSLYELVEEYLDSMKQREYN